MSTEYKRGFHDGQGFGGIWRCLKLVLLIADLAYSRGPPGSDWGN